MSRRRPSSVFDEPHLQPTSPPADPDRPADSVWQEPTTAGQQAVTPYAEWLIREQQTRTPAAAWRLTLGLSLIAGPLAVATALMKGGPGSLLLLVIVAGPLVEEIGKIMAPLMVVERNPARFTHSAQVMVCGAMAGLLFAVIENVLYLKVYIPDPSPALVLWRWTVCVALHTGCSLVAASGVARVRTTSLQEGAPPALEHGARRILLAVVLHGVYNALALLLDPLFAG